MKILAIDTSCDDTSVAISDNLNILANVFWSKIKVHSKWGGVVPSVAKRQHQEFLGPAVKEVVRCSGIKLSQIDYFAITKGPGLAIALEPGIQKAKELAVTYKKPLVAVNHMIGHIYSNITRNENGLPYSSLYDFEFPALALTISGGHTDLYLMRNHLKFQHLGYTLDDSIGEAFDKIGRMLGMGFPAGAKVEKAALKGDPNKYSFPHPLSTSNDYNWSYSGLKTAVLYQIQKLIGNYNPKPAKKMYKLDDASKKLSLKQINDISASFQKAAVESLLIKVEKAIKEYNPKMVVIGGGVIANLQLRNQLKNISKKYNVPIYYPKPMWLCTDNAAMIATAGYFYIKYNKIVKNMDKLDRIPNLEI